MSIRQGNKVISAGTSLTQDLFDFKWSDHELNDIQWARADNFLWYNADTYEVAYNHLLEEWNTVGDNLTSETISGTTVYYRLAADGHKICPATQETAVNTIYNSTGVAWYYILDTDGQRFKLPRTKYGFSGFRDTVGKYIPESLPNIKGTAGGYIPNQYAGYSGAFTSDTTTPGSSHVFNPDSSDYNRMKFDASLSSSTYKNGAAVQERSTQMYLYFFVGNFSQEALVNIKGGPTTLTQKSITNCITEIPQDIKLELNNGTLTLKAGSKVYVPNGFEQGETTPKFDEVVIESDVNFGSTDISTTTYICSYYPSLNSIEYTLVNDCTSGISYGGSTFGLFYNTSANTCKRTDDGGSTWRDNSFPLCIINTTNGVGVSSIDQVFNGFGYIGSTVFALPGVKGLIPDGRNVDGTLKNIEFATSSVLTIGYDVSYDNYKIALNSNYIGVYVSHPIDRLEYKEQENINYNNYVNNIERIACVGYISCNGTQITTLEPKNAFHAVDYSEADFVVKYQRPTSLNNYKWYRLYKSGWIEQGQINTSHTGETGETLIITMADTAYTVSMTVKQSGDYWLGAYDIATTGFKYRIHNRSAETATVTIDWEVKGFAA